MREHEPVLSWLLQEDNPGVRVRALTGLCGYAQDHQEVTAARRLVIQWLAAARDLSWTEMKGQIVIYNLAALAESGLTRQDVPIETAAEKILSQPFDANCGDLMALRALVMLGYGNDPRIEGRFDKLQEVQLPDGGWLCLHRVKKMSRVPKSCIRAAMHGLLFFAESKRAGLHVRGEGPLIGAIPLGELRLAWDVNVPGLGKRSRLAVLGVPRDLPPTDALIRKSIADQCQTMLQPPQLSGARAAPGVVPTGTRLIWTEWLICDTIKLWPSANSGHERANHAAAKCIRWKTRYDNAFPPGWRRPPLRSVWPASLSGSAC